MEKTSSRGGPVVALRNVTKTYQVGKESVHALRDISLNVDEAEFLAITGPSGSGKTTLMNIAGCLDVPTEGGVFLRDKRVSDLDDSALSRIRGEEVGFVFQTFNLIPRISALHNVILPMNFSAKISRDGRASRAQGLLAKVGLSQRINHRPTEMSGGERQRVAIARALANDPSVVLADEPTGNLDSETGKGIMELFKTMNGEGRTLVVVTHNPMVAGYASRTILLRDGRMVNSH